MLATLLVATALVAGSPPTAQSYTVTEFTAGANGAGSVHQLVNGSGSALYDFCAQTNCTDGSNPTNIINSPWGWYGFTANGGTHGSGTIFKLTPSSDPTVPWTETVIYNFCSAMNCDDGANPTSSLWIDGNWIIGSTANQGANGRGTIIGQFLGDGLRLATLGRPLLRIFPRVNFGAPGVAGD